MKKHFNIREHREKLEIALQGTAARQKNFIGSEGFAVQIIVIYRDITTRRSSEIYVTADVFSFSNASITSVLHDPVLLG